MECVDRLPLLIWHCLHHSPSIKEKPRRRRQHLARLADHPSPSRSSLLELSRFPRMCESESNANPFIILSIFIVNNQFFLAIPWSKMAKKNRFLLPSLESESTHPYCLLLRSLAILISSLPFRKRTTTCCRGTSSLRAPPAASPGAPTSTSSAACRTSTGSTSLTFRSLLFHVSYGQ